ncbi:transcriptional regulatory protein AlgP [Aedes albopictus]|uniref:Cuticle protein n=1 Tax=Aedes albopictus TaxID=7160 RepID=A0ABM1YX60_AEDAL|nr:uncharacterized protein LOC109397392 [Aedes albopictus]
MDIKHIQHFQLIKPILKNNRIKMFAKMIIVACLAVAAVNAEAKAEPGVLAAAAAPLAYTTAGFAAAPLAYAGLPAAYTAAAYSAPLVARPAAYAAAAPLATPFAAAYTASPYAYAAAPAYPYLRAAAAYPALI